MPCPGRSRPGHIPQFNSMSLPELLRLLAGGEERGERKKRGGKGIRNGMKANGQRHLYDCVF